MHKITDEFEFRTSLNFGKIEPLKKLSHTLTMGKWCLYASSFIFDQSIIKVAGNQTGIKAQTSSISGL